MHPSDYGDVIREYLRKYHNQSDMAIARILRAELPKYFSMDLESARARVRYYRKRIKNNKGEYFAVDPVPRTNNISRENPFGVPESYAVQRAPFNLPLACNNILWISDLHIPYHISAAINCALRYGKDEKVNTIMIGGDLIDNHNLSSYEKDPHKRNQTEEFRIAEEFLFNLRASFPTASIYFMLGNHDIRWERWLRAHPEVFGDPYFDLETRLKCVQHRVTVIEDKTIVNAGKLAMHHGHYIFKGKTSPVSPARTILLKAKQSMMCGHTHKVSEATSTNLDGSIHTAFSTGSLCELTPDYSPMCNEYAHGFAHIKVKPSGNFTARNYRILDGDIL